ncbi:hypothetical protein SteCoe_16084 [Stentor coeruleus]|uniref:Uncharacterized protein n=1 Tax=Stentor coeruleus TaxID=5963 RepID=A0A1R2C1X3_9CILI|nr:hypothetical protein SteCoe_16084 [Stentor coeruleus]
MARKILVNFLPDVENILQQSMRDVSEEEAASLNEICSMVMQEDIEIYSRSTVNPRFLNGKANNSTLEYTLIPMNYSDIKSTMTRLKPFAEFRSDHSLLRKYEYDVINNTWFLLLSLKKERLIPLNDCFKTMQNHKSTWRIPIESILYMIITSVELANEIYNISGTIGSLHIQNVYFKIKDSTSNNIEAETVFEFFTPEHLQKKVLNPNIYLEKDYYTVKGFFWSLGVLIYSCLSGTDIENLPNFALLSKSERNLLVQNLAFVPKLTSLLNKLFDGKYTDIEKFIKKSCFQTWGVILGINKISPQRLSPRGFYTTFYFFNKETIMSNMILADDPCDFINVIDRSPNFNLKVLVKIIQTLTELPEYHDYLLEYFLRFLLKLKFLSEETISKYCFPLICRIAQMQIDLSNEKNRRLVIEVLVSIFYDSTITILMIFKESGIIDTLYKEYPQDCKLLFPYLSNMGTNSLSLIRTLRIEKKFPDPNSIIHYIQQIPIHFKLKITNQILSEINEVMSTWIPALQIDSNKIELISSAMIIIYEILKGFENSNLSNKLGKCYDNKSGYNVFPAMGFCEECKKQYCMSCISYHMDLNHKVKYLTHKCIFSFDCAVEKSLWIDVNELHKEYSKEFKSKIANCSELDVTNYEIEGDWHIWNMKTIKMPDIKTRQNFFYGEFYLEHCQSEDIQIIIEDTGIVFDNRNQSITKFNSHICKTPRLGMMDTVGIGLTADSNVFFTYNGFSLVRLIPFQAEAVKIILKIRSKKPPVIIGNAPCLFNCEAYDRVDEDSIQKFTYIINHFVVLDRLKNKILKKNGLGTSNLNSVIDDLSKVLDKEKLMNTIKSRKSGSKKEDSQGQGCKPF